MYRSVRVCSVRVDRKLVFVRLAEKYYREKRNTNPTEKSEFPLFLETKSPTVEILGSICERNSDVYFASESARGR